jgi:hypothetical protein
MFKRSALQAKIRSNPLVMALERILKRVVQVLTFITAGLGIFFTLGSQKIENAPTP